MDEATRPASRAAILATAVRGSWEGAMGDVRRVCKDVRVCRPSMGRGLRTIRPVPFVRAAAGFVGAAVGFAGAPDSFASAAVGFAGAAAGFGGTAL
jgi:hypothetical protein